METCEQLEALGQAELIHGADLGADDTEDDIDPEPLPNDAGAEAPELVRVGEIHVAAFGELRALSFGEETGGERGSLFGGQLRRIRPDRLEDSVRAAR